MRLKTADGRVVAVGKVYYAVVGHSIKRVRCRSLHANCASFSEIGLVVDQWRYSKNKRLEYYLPNIYRSFAKAQEFIIERITAKLEQAKKEARRIPSLKGQITRVKALS